MVKTNGSVEKDRLKAGVKGPPYSCSLPPAAAPELPLRDPRAAWDLVRTTEGLLLPAGGGGVVTGHAGGSENSLSHLAWGAGGHPLFP